MSVLPLETKFSITSHTKKNNNIDTIHQCMCEGHTTVVFKELKPASIVSTKHTELLLDCWHLKPATYYTVHLENPAVLQ